MRRITLSSLAVALVAGLLTLFVPAAEAGPGPCSNSEVLVRGRVTDAATGQPLQEVTSVEFHELDGTPIDGGGTDGNSRWYLCSEPGDQFKIKFVADSYRPEWWNDQPNLASATAITVPAEGPLVLDAALRPKGLVIAGRVTNANGVPKFASVSIWRRTAAGWRPYDGIANTQGKGWYEFRAPGPGRYRISASVDHHKSRWATSATRLSRARTFRVTATDPMIDDGHIRVPYCSASPDFCVPPGFLT